MSDPDCTAFLQWALPRLDLQWTGFRKVRGQICKRLKRRIRGLELASFGAYRALLEADPKEWAAVDAACRITISRFFRDRRVFETIRDRILPAIARRVEQEQRQAACWSVGCGSGEEPSTIRLLWDLNIATSASLSIVGTDVDDVVLARAHHGCYPAGALRGLPSELTARGFEQKHGLFCLCERHRRGISFMKHDVRSDPIAGLFDLILCRNLAFTYFGSSLQDRVLQDLLAHLQPGGYLVIGAHERLPRQIPGIVAVEREVFRKGERLLP
jgi:chemotaxis protein methyltransferase CheR